MHKYVSGLEKIFIKNGNREEAAWAKAYLRNQFECFGIKTPLRRELCKKYMIGHLPAYEELSEIVKDLWGQPQREFQYFATELLSKYRNEWQEELIELIEFMLINKSWWDTVDHIATDLTGPYFKIFPAQIRKVTGKWNCSKNIWLQRSSLMFQKAYREKTDTALLSTYILKLSDSNEFFIQKAIGWALREYSKTNPKWVKEFVKKNRLPKLSEREALRRISHDF